jgi:hypothetical protein
MQKRPTSFLLYTELETPFNFLSLEDRGRLITYIFQYVRLGEVDLSDASDLVKLAFSMIKVYLDRDREHYEEKCRINAENGRKGGRPRKSEDPEREEAETEGLPSEAEETEGLPTEAKKAYNNNNYNNKYNNNYSFNYNNKLGCGGNRGGAYDAKEKKKEKFGESEWDHPDCSFDTDVFFAAALKRSYENI